MRKTIIAYVKDESSNLNAMIVILKFVVNCETLSFGITLSKDLYCAFFLKIFSICHHKWNLLQRFPICFNKICVKRFAKNGQFVEENWQKQTRVELNIVLMLVSTQENKIF